MNGITAILTAYRRPTLLRSQAEAVRTQSKLPQAVWLWANEPNDAMSSEIDSLEWDRAVVCKPNAFVHGRFALALLAQTEYVAVFDDDALPGAEWFANCLEVMQRTPGILGAAGVRLTGANYRGRTLYGWHVPTDETVEVDLVGHAWFLRTEWVRYLFASPAVVGTNGEDIELAARAFRLGGIRCYCPPHPTGEHRRWGSLNGVELGSDAVAHSRRASHLDERDGTVRAEIGSGWRPLFLREPSGDSDLSGRSAEGVADRPQPDRPSSLATTVFPPLGCVLAVYHRPLELLERTLQSYALQMVPILDRVLVDYGSEPSFADPYRRLTARYGWRYIPIEPNVPGWCLSDAYNRGVAALDEKVEVVFKGDADVILGEDVLRIGAEHGSYKLCIFSCRAAWEGTLYPDHLCSVQDVQRLLETEPPPEPMLGEGIVAFPRAWFTRIGGYDLAYRSWGFEDSDLRERANGSIGVARVADSVLIHQWHPRADGPIDAWTKNRAYYERMKQSDQLIRNGGCLVPPTALASALTLSAPGPSPAAVFEPEPIDELRVAVVTRSTNDYLSTQAGTLARLDDFLAESLGKFERHCLRKTDSLGYFRELLRLDVDWVVNLDEDAFVLNRAELLGLIRYMDLHGYAACGMPDGGVVRIRRHNPIACNACFNVFDLRRVRAVWKEWSRVLAARHHREYEAGVAPFARRTPFAFDDFEPYYGLFFSLLDAGERVLYLDAEEWQDGVSTLLKSHTGKPLLLHAWYTRNWMHSYHTRRRYCMGLDYARHAQGMDCGTFRAETCPEPAVPKRSNSGRWALHSRTWNSPQPYGDTRTYRMAAEYMAGLETVEDWGCGCAWLKQYLPACVRYKGIDGTESSFADEVADLTQYCSDTDGIVLRHVLEHDPNWSLILHNAVRSFRKRLVLVLFTPFAETTRPIAENASLGVPDLSFAKADLIHHFADLRWSLEAGLPTKTQYGVEHVFFIEKA